MVWRALLYPQPLASPRLDPVTYSAACNASAQYLLKPFSISWEKSLRSTAGMDSCTEIGGYWFSFTSMHILPLNIIEQYIFPLWIYQLLRGLDTSNCMLSPPGWRNRRTFNQVTRTAHILLCLASQFCTWKCPEITVLVPTSTPTPTLHDSKRPQNHVSNPPKVYPQAQEESHPIPNFGPHPLGP